MLRYRVAIRDTLYIKISTKSASSNLFSGKNAGIIFRPREVISKKEDYRSKETNSRLGSSRPKLYSEKEIGRRQEMNWRDFMTLMYFVAAAILFGIVGWITLSPAVKWAAPAVALGLIAVGLGINSLALVNRIDRKLGAMSETIDNIEQIQEAMQKEQNEKAGSHSTIGPTLQAFSQLYMDYLAKKPSGEEPQRDSNDT
ncbi:phage holin family protein [Chloroflexota bacterium]